MMGYYNTYGWNSWMLIVMLIWLLVLAAAILGMVWITRDRAGPRRGLSEETPIEEVLESRFASGDITTEEYLESRAILNNDSSRAASLTRRRRMRWPHSFACWWWRTNPDLAAVVAAYLRNEGFDVDIAENGPDAVLMANR